MSGLIYTTLNQESTFPSGSREQSAVEGCPPQAGYHAVYSLFRLHHPLLHSVFSTASEIPRQRRTEPFSLYIRRLQDFMVRERQATRTYTESDTTQQPDTSRTTTSLPLETTSRRLAHRNYPNSEFPERETPFPPDYTFSKDNRPVTDHDKHIIEERHKRLPFRSAACTLLHLAYNTRADILFAVCKLARACICPGKTDFRALIWLIGYL
jgi:hypothetical protein